MNSPDYYLTEDVQEYHT